MPEQVSQLIPTLDELQLRRSDTSDEPESRLLGKSIAQLQTRGDRLDFIDKAENQAHVENASFLTNQARELLLDTSPLNNQERQELLGLVDVVATDFTTLRKKSRLLGKDMRLNQQK